MSDPASPCSLDTAAVTIDPPSRSVAAAVLVAPDARYLLQFRDDKPGLHLAAHWALFGGALEPGEDAETALRREVTEELTWTPREVQPLVVTVQAIWPSLKVRRLHFFTVPFTSADLGQMVQTEGQDKGLFSIDAACRLERVAPWDLCALLLHARMSALFPAGIER